MRLFEHEDFPQALLRAAVDRGVSEQFVEKDYYVTEILRIVVAELEDKAMFKGGTSLSKGWALITRFSEDIDLSLRLPLALRDATRDSCGRSVRARNSERHLSQ